MEKCADCSAATFEQEKTFWTILFEEHEIARKIPSLVNCDGHSGEVSSPSNVFNVTGFDEVLVNTKPASSLGDNFFSDAYLIEATILKSNTSLNVFAKIMPGNVLMREAVYESRAHHREHNIYKVLFEILRETRGNLPIPLDVPKFYYGKIEEINEECDGSGTCILLENLKKEGYQMVDKSKGLDDDQIRLALSSLAHYHALSIAALRQFTRRSNSQYGTQDCIEEALKEKEIEFLLEKTIADQSPVETIQPWLEVFIDLANDINRPDLSIWLSEFREKLTDIMQLDTIENGGPIVCIAHGDYWSNNILFKYESNEEETEPTILNTKPTSMKMVDFQICRISHPMSDILYFLYISALPQLRKEQLENWLKMYFATLVDDLKLLQIDLGKYDWSSFLVDYKKRSLRWMLYGGMIMALVHNNVVIDVLNDIHQTEIQKGAAEGYFGESKNKEAKNGNPSTKLATTLSEAMKRNKLSLNPTLTERLISLFDEVKALNSS